MQRRYLGSISSHGGFVAFASRASNLVADDTNERTDVFVRDVRASVTERVSLNSSGAQVDGDNIHPVISGDGRYVAFWSEVPDMDPAHPAKEVSAPLYVRDRQPGPPSWSPSTVTGTRPGITEDDPRSPRTAGSRSSPARTGSPSDDTDKRWDVFIRDRVEDHHSGLGRQLLHSLHPRPTSGLGRRTLRRLRCSTRPARSRPALRPRHVARYDPCGFGDPHVGTRVADRLGRSTCLLP